MARKQSVILCAQQHSWLIWVALPGKHPTFDWILHGCLELMYAAPLLDSVWHLVQVYLYTYLHTMCCVLTVFLITFGFLLT